MTKFLTLLTVFGIIGCSNKALYDSARLHQRNECAKEPPPAYSDCIERTNKSYEAYERERKEALETQPR